MTIRFGSAVRIAVFVAALTLYVMADRLIELWMEVRL